MLTGIGIGVPFTRKRGFSAGDLFANSEVGVWYDPSDLTTMFQDSAGTTAVTAVGQPVGLILDKSKGLVLGPDVVVNGGFDTDTSWTKGAGVTITGGQCVFTSVSSGVTVNQESCTIGKWYEITFDVISITAGAFGPLRSPTPSATTAGTYTWYFLAAATTDVSIRAVGTTSGVIDNVVVKELPGNHASQSTSTARPVLRAGIDYDGVDDSHAQSAGGGSTTAFFLCAGIKPEGGADAARTLWSDAGTNTGYIVRLNASNQLELAAGNGVAYTTIATVATISVGTAYVVTAWDDGTNLNVQVDNGAVASVARPVVSAGTSTATIGKDNGAATGFHNGLIYSLIQLKNDAGTESERTNTKAYVANKSGVTL